MTSLKKAVRRVTNSRLPAAYGADRDRRIVVTLIPGNGKDVPDLMELRPERTRRGEVVAIEDVYHYAIRCRINKGQLEKARATKARQADARERRRLQRGIVR